MTPDELKQARLKLGLTQGAMATMTGYGGRQRWNEVESGVRSPSGAVARLVQAYLDGYRPSDWPA